MKRRSLLLRSSRDSSRLHSNEGPVVGPAYNKRFQHAPVLRTVAALRGTRHVMPAAVRVRTRIVFGAAFSDGEGGRLKPRNVMCHGS